MSKQDTTNAAEQELAEQLLNGVQTKSQASTDMRENLHDLFKPNDYVIVKNPFNHSTGWVCVNPSEEVNERPDKISKLTTFGKPKSRVLKVGERVVVHGWEAYVGITRMFKEYAQEKGGNLQVILSSQLEISSFIDSAYDGIFDPEKMLNATNAQTAAQEIKQRPVEVSDNALESLGFDDKKEDSGKKTGK